MEKTVTQVPKTVVTLLVFALLAALSLLLLGGQKVPEKRDAVHRAAAQIAAESSAFRDGTAAQMVEKRPVVLLRANAVVRHK